MEENSGGAGNGQPQTVIPENEQGFGGLFLSGEDPERIAVRRGKQFFCFFYFFSKYPLDIFPVSVYNLCRTFYKVISRSFYRVEKQEINIQKKRWLEHRNG